MEQEPQQREKCSAVDAALRVRYCDLETHSFGNARRKKFTRQLKLGPAHGAPMFQRRVRSLCSLSRAGTGQDT